MSSSSSSSGGVRVYVGGLSSRVRIEDLESHFSSYRPLRVDLKNGFAFLEFGDRDTAADAIRRENGSRLLDDKIAVEMSRGVRRERIDSRRIGSNDRSDRGERADRGGDRGDRGDRNDRGGDRGDRDRYAGERKPRGYKIDVENLDPKTSWQDLKDFARTAGNVAFADVRNDRGMKVGVISYEAYDDYKHALRVLHDTKLHGQRVKLYAQRRSASPRGRSRSPPRRTSRSRSPAARRASRSRSRSPARRAASYSSRDRDASPRRRSPSPKRSSPKYEKYDKADNSTSASTTNSTNNSNSSSGGSNNSSGNSTSEYGNGNRENDRDRDRSPRD